jgi:hypothetical protein
MKRLVLVVLIAGIAASSGTSGPAEAAIVDRACLSVRAGGYLASSLHAQKVTCRSARTKLRRWLRRGSLPKNPDGWLCYREEGLRICSYLGGSLVAPNFYFVLTRP